MILVDESIKVLLEEHALSIGEDPVWLGDLFRGNGSPYSQLIKHVPGHDAHMHVRFSSPVARERGRRAYATLVRQGHLKIKSTKVVHRVSPGDTLIGIAKGHATSVAEIMQSNHLKSKVIRVGQKLEIQKPQHLRGALEAVTVPRRRLPRPQFERKAITSGPTGPSASGGR
jgi:LysM repeat protein